MLSTWTIKGQEAARGFYLTAWSGDQPYVVDRKETGTTRIDPLFIVISGGVAALIGYEILPAIAVLEGDGVPKAEVHRLLSRAKVDREHLIEACEAARLKLKGGIQYEYSSMKTGGDSLLALLDGAAELAQPRTLTS